MKIDSWSTWAKHATNFTLQT